MCYSGYNNKKFSRARTISALFVFLRRFRGSLPPQTAKGAEPVGMYEETRKHELEHAARLDNKQRGDIAEMAFMRKAAAMGFSVAKPWADGERYDFVVRSGKTFWRVQVKSVRALHQRRKYYPVALASRRAPYTADEIDFLVAYLFPEDAWYVFPASVVENRRVLCIGSKPRKFQQYREAWKLMECPIRQAAADCQLHCAGSAGENTLP